MNLENLYNNHENKISDKWSSYIEKYDELFFKYKNLAINLLEIGIQNGGSLEIYSKYFLKAKNIIGNDIHPKCNNLKFSDQRVNLIIGDANDNTIKEQILKLPKFDIIIDDGSHTSPDIIKSFVNYYNHLNEGGIYIVEDLHCSYWKQYHGGLFFPISSISFFKKIVDIINFDHWGIDKNLEWFLKLFIFNYKIDLKDLDFQSIGSIEFINSMCIIKKQSNAIGDRVIKGKIAEVAPEIKNMGKDDLEKNKVNQVNNIFTNVKLLPEEELFVLKEKFKKIKDKVG
jgi:hypothetical protein|tara:strand:+ start:519 stop:1373 length:855 start_codon:yes stop_codon:yes gene_type:complete